MLISIDHGNKSMKLAHSDPFTSGLVESDVPSFNADTLKYRGKYYQLSDQRIPYRRNKTEDDRFFVLTLFAIAREINAMGRYTTDTIRVQLAVGLPPAHFNVGIIDGKTMLLHKFIEQGFLVGYTLGWAFCLILLG